MVTISWKICCKKWMIWGYHHFGKPPNIYIYICIDRHRYTRLLYYVLYIQISVEKWDKVSVIEEVLFGDISGISMGPPSWVIPTCAWLHPLGLKWPWPNWLAKRQVPNKGSAVVVSSCTLGVIDSTPSTPTSWVPWLQPRHPRTPARPEGWLSCGDLPRSFSGIRISKRS